MTLFTKDGKELPPAVSTFDSVTGKPIKGHCEGAIYFDNDELIPKIGRWILIVDPDLPGVTVNASFFSIEGIPIDGVKLGATFIGKPPGIAKFEGEIELSLTN